MSELLLGVDPMFACFRHATRGDIVLLIYLFHAIVVIGFVGFFISMISTVFGTVWQVRGRVVRGNTLLAAAGSVESRLAGRWTKW